jgi:hypothetical protein
MDRRQFLFIISGAAALLGAARTAHAECGEQTANEFVRALYERQAELLAANKPLSDDEFYELFARDLRRLMKAPRRTRNNQPIGPILNAFFGWGVLPGTEVKIGKIALVSGARRPSVSTSAPARTGTGSSSMSCAKTKPGVSPTSSMIQAGASSVTIAGLRWADPPTAAGF